ncbi:inositol polyphosphate multikinase [Lucilia cuprina]|uniref:inositol polyphosphate multikinase n=1 Tax=Lucilia cuprina TaxID=7375 RepID=UPI001F06033B|nr:inositol polyphosphate multikinase [Lucilia cuprina]
MNQLQPQLPKGFTLLENQVAGHTFSPDTQALGMLKDASVGCVLKPMGKPQCGERELSFYESITNASDPVLVKARDLVPKFYNKLKLQVNCKEHTFLKLEDLSHGMLKPCIMDIKIGKRTWDPLASPQKRQVEEQKYLHSKQVLGLCLPGFQVYKNGVLKKYGKDYGKQLDTTGLRDTIRNFLNAEHKVCQPLVQEVLRQLYLIHEWFKQQTVLHFYASSLLIVYDCEALDLVQYAQQNGSLLTNGDIDAQLKSSHHINSNPPTDEKCLQQHFTHSNQTTILQNFVKVRMIDFAHVFPAEDGQLDSNYLFGLENLIKIIEEFNI